MDQSTITFCYRKIIDANSSSLWEKLVFDDSYLEFRIQFQNFNKEHKYFTFAELVRERADAEQLHFLVSPSVSGYIQQLQGKIPDIVDALGKQFLNFSYYRFELINTDIRYKQGHQVAINFYSSEMNWHQTIGNSLLLSKNSADAIDGVIATHLYQLQSFVSIHTLKLNP